MINGVGLRYFMGVARVGSIRRAAEDLHVAASAISRQIQLLEDDLGALLFERRPGQKVMRLTPEGQAVLEFGRGIEASIDHVKADIKSINTLQRGNVRLGVSESFTREFIPRFLKQFHDEYPGIVFEVFVGGGSKLMQMLADDELDLTLSYLAPESLDVTAVEEVTVKPSILVANGHPLAKHKTVELADIAGYELALPDDTISNLRSSYVRMFMKAKVKPKGVLVTNSFELMRASAMAGLCVAIVNNYFAGPKPPRGFVYVPIVGRSAESWTLKVCVRSDRTLPVAPRMFLDTLRSAVKSVT